jgi:hypothetical protein
MNENRLVILVPWGRTLPPCEDRATARLPQVLPSQSQLARLRPLCKMTGCRIHIHMVLSMCTQVSSLHLASAARRRINSDVLYLPAFGSLEFDATTSWYATRRTAPLRCWRSGLAAGREFAPPPPRTTAQSRAPGS